jgi:hypothetical protein
VELELARPTGRIAHIEPDDPIDLRARVEQWQ